MKKIFFIILLCFMIVFAAFTIDMSPHPGDSLDMILTVQDYVVISQAENVPAVNVLHIEQFNYTNEICLSANEEIIGTTNDIFNSGLIADMAVSYIGYEMENILYKTGEDVAIYKTEFG